MTLGQMLRARRKLLGSTQEEVARRADVSRATISGWESGVVEPGLGALGRLLDVLAVHDARERAAYYDAAGVSP